MPSPKENAFSVFNEIMVSLYLYTLIHLTDFFGDNNYREEGGYVLVGIIMVSVIVNIMKFITLVIREIRAIIRKKRLEKVRKGAQTLDVHQAKTLSDNPGIFAYANDPSGLERVAEIKAEALKPRVIPNIPTVNGPIA